MTLYTSKVIAQWLCLTERRVRQLRDEGVIVEARPGLYELQPTVARYIKYITIVGANSATGLASRPIKVLLADEVDRYPGSAGTEGDPLSLAQKRQTTFWDKKTVMVSTPVIKGHSRIETEYNQSTREEWNVPCPECGHYQPFVWANLIFDPDDLQKEIVYKCERCGCVANEYRWKQQSQQGRFVAENPGAETRGFHLNTLASTFCGSEKFFLTPSRPRRTKY